MKQEINNCLDAFSQLSDAINALSSEWSENDKYRNRPRRQKLTSELIELLPRAYDFGKVIDKILQECEIDLDESNEN